MSTCRSPVACDRTAGRCAAAQDGALQLRSQTCWNAGGPLLSDAARDRPLLGGADPARALVQPERVVKLKPRSGDGGAMCVISADYLISGSTMRVEVGAILVAGSGLNVLACAYTPSSVGPPMRDIWLKTPTLFSLGRFKSARENGNGIREARGEVSSAEGGTILSEISVGDIEISIVFDGTMPAAWFPVGLPQPLPIEMARALDDCAGQLVPQAQP